jgi:hypothetical protein
MTKGRLSAKQINERKWKRMLTIIEGLEKQPLDSKRIFHHVFGSKPKRSDLRTFENYMAELRAIKVISYDEKTNTYASTRYRIVMGTEDYKTALDHSRLLVLTTENAQSEADLHLDEYSPVQIKEMFFSKESVASDDYYFLQHIKTGYPEISELITKHMELSIELPKRKTEIQDIEDLLVGKIVTIVDGVRTGKALLGYCDCCPKKSYSIKYS